MKIFAWIVIALIIAILLAFLVFLISGAVVFHITLGRKDLKRRVKKNNLVKNLEKYKIDLCWWDKYNFKKVEIESFDKLKLVGHFLNQNSDITVVLVHGYSANYKEMQPYAKFFYQKGFNILCIENRAHGESEGEFVGMGIVDRLDIGSWIKFLNETEKKKIVLFGISMGATAVCASTADLPNNVVAAIADSPFDDAGKQIKFVMKKYKILQKPLYLLLKSYTKRQYNFDLTKTDIKQFVKKSDIPILYIHGKNDNYVLPDCSLKLYEATKENLRELFLVDSAEHIMSYAVLGNIYERKINKFLEKYKILGG